MSSVGTVAAHQLCGPLRWKRESPVQPNNPDAVVDPDAVVVDDSGDNAGRALLTIVSAQHEELVILTVQGSIDVLTAPQLSEAVTNALTGQPRGLIIDLTTTDFLASAGMAALVAAHEAIAPTGLFGVVAAEPATSRPLTLMGLDQTIVLYPSLAHAVTAMTDPTEMTGTPTG